MNPCHDFFFYQEDFKTNFPKRKRLPVVKINISCATKKCSSEALFMVENFNFRCLNKNHSLFVRRDCHMYSRPRLVPNFGEKQTSGWHTRSARDSKVTRHVGSAGRVVTIWFWRISLRRRIPSWIPSLWILSSSFLCWLLVCSIVFLKYSFTVVAMFSIWLWHVARMACNLFVFCSRSCNSWSSKSEEYWCKEIGR